MKFGYWNSFDVLTQGFENRDFINLALSLRVILLVYRRLLSFWSCHVMYRIVVSYCRNRYLLGVGLQKVYCQFRFLLSSFFLLDRFIPNFGNLLNLISYIITGYFRSYLFKFYFMYFFPLSPCLAFLVLGQLHVWCAFIPEGILCTPKAIRSKVWILIFPFW